MTYTTRKNTSRLWPIAKKGTKYVITPSHEKNAGVPLLIIVRDMLRIVDTKKELKKILLEKKVLVNNKLEREENRTLLLFDTLKLKEVNQCYRLVFNEYGKVSMKEISDKECGVKICKVVSKKMLKGKKIQLNFNDGINILSNEKISVGDCVLINLESKKIEKVIPIKEKSKILIIKGKYLGREGEIQKIERNELTIKTRKGYIKTKIEEVIISE